MQKISRRLRTRLVTGRVAVILVMLLFVVAPPPAQTAAATLERPAPARIAVSTPIFADIVANVAGDRFTVTSVIPTSADPHTYEASPQDVVALSRSRSFIYMGANLEPFIDAGAWRRAVRDAGIPELRLADHLSLIKVERVIDHGDHVHDLRDGDPHVWLDPTMVVAMLDPIAAHLSELDPAGASGFTANAAVYREALLTLDREIEAGIEQIPQHRRKLVVFHDAYTYFAARYSFDVLGYVLKSPGREPSAQEIAELHQTIEAAGVNVVFKEPQFSAIVLDRIAEDRGIVVAELLTDSFAGRVEKYVDLMRFNLASLVTHLGSSAS